MAVQECFHNGRTIYIISENDLQHVKKAGRRIRAQCPVHHSRDRDLSVAPYYDGMTDEDHHLAGWGYCHSAKCQATVLVREWNPGAAAAMLREPVQPIKPRLTLSSEELERADVWQERELLALEKLYPRMQAQLQHPRVQAYLAGRGLAAMGDLLESLGAGYIPPIGDRWNGWIEVQDAKGKARVSLAKWCDRLVFPHTARDGSRHFIGRTLHLWEPGMDENEHKRLLDELEQQAKEEYGEARGSRYAIKRYEKTYKSGFLHAAAMQAHQRILICEGVFDLLPLLYEGLENAVAISGTHIDVQAIPVHVRSCTLAFDADLKNGAAIASTCEKLGYAGITFDFLSPPDDQRGKDWSERYRLHGRGGLEPLLATAQQIAVAQGDEEVCVVCGRALIEGDVAHEIEFYYDADGTLYCAEHWPGHDRTDTQTDQDSQEASPVSSSLPGSGRLDRNTQGVIPVDGEFPAGANDSSAASANSESAPFPVATTAQMHDQALDDPVVQELMRAFGPLAKEGGIRTSDVYPAAGNPSSAAPTSPCWPESAVRASLAVEALGLIPSGNVERAVDPHLEGGRCTRDRCPDDYGDYAALCPTRFPHAPVPPWYTNAPYDPGRPKGPTHWQKFVRAVGLANAIKQRQAFIDGFVDTHGIWRCGHCYLRQRMMDLGAQLGYPDMHALYPLAETRGVAGYASWLAVNCSAGETLMQTVGRQAGAVVANLCRFFQTIALACRQRALHVAREAA